MKRSIILLSALTLSIQGVQSNHAVPLYIAFRSQSVDTARHLAGGATKMFHSESDEVSGLLAATIQYSHTFDSRQITKNFFGPALQDDSLVVSGSSVANRSSQDWLADYFLLPQDFKSSISFKPTMKQYLVDFQWHLNLSQWCEGLYCTVYAPLVHLHNHIKIDETIINHGVTDFAPGIFSPQPLTVGSLNKDFSCYIDGNTLTSIDADPLQDIDQSLANRSITIALQPLKRAMIAQDGHTKTRVADLRAILGWNASHHEQWSMGLYGMIAAPTGTRPKGILMFEPMIGNGGHWEAGVGLKGMWKLWRSRAGTYSLSLAIDTALSHLFEAQQHRTFDLINKPFSRYMLAMKFKQAIADNLKGGGSTPSAQFDNEIAPLANLTTLNVHTSAAFQCDGTAMLTMAVPHWNFDIGYNLWTRSTESVTSHDNADISLNTESWALKGDARIFGFIPSGNGATLAQNTPIALSATQNGATINKGLNGTTNLLNQNIDGAKLATADTNNVQLQNGTTTTLATNGQIYTSINPIFITEKDLEKYFGRSRGLSHAIFGNIQYHWVASETWQPGVSCGFKVEFDAHRHHGTTVTTGASSWNLWLKGTVCFE